MPSPKLLALLLGAASLQATDLTVTRLKTGDITRSVQLLGEVHANQQVALYAKVGGYVSSLKVDIGDHVAEGAVLAELEVPELVADEARTRAELTVAELEFKRIQEAFKQAPDLVMRQTVDNAAAKLAVAKAQQERNATLLGFAKIKAPFAGVISRRSVDKGAFVPAATGGSAGGQAALFVLTDAAVVRVQAALPEYEANLVAVGQPVTVTNESNGAKSYEAKVTRLSGVLENASKTMVVESVIPNPQGTLKPGMFANVKLGIETHKATTLLPLNAIVMEKAVATAYVNEGGKARRRVLKAGFNDGQNLEVLGGVTAGEDILVVGTTAITDGQAVTLAK
jgi:membrane fusion protein (multidrug efflux system)